MAGLPQVGLEAVIEGLGQFQAGAASIQKAFEDINAKAGTVQSSTSGFSSAFSSLGSSLGTIGNDFVNLGQGVMRFGAIAGGVALGGVVALGAGIVALGASAVGEFAKYERMSLSIQNLVAREISQGQVVEQQTQTRIGLTQKEAAEMAAIPQKITDETLSRQTLAARIQEQQQKIIQLTAAYGDNGLNVQVAKARLAEMENEYNKSGSAIDILNGRLTELNSKNTDLTTTLQKVRVGQMSMSDAMTQAAPKAKELLNWIQLLAIQSPFNQEGIANAFQTAMAYGFTADEAKRLTQAEVDFAAATGKSVETTNQIALALGQVQAKGKVSGQEIIQLTNAGVGVNKILEDMGFTLDDVSKGLVDSDKFIQAVITDMEVFKGAAKDQSTTFAGLIASLEDLKSIGLREFFTGTFKAIQPYLINFVNFLTDAALTSGSIRSLGDAIGQGVGNALATVSNLVAQFQRWGPEGIFAAMGFKSSSLFIASVKSLFSLITSQLPSAQSMFEGFSSVITYLQANLFPALMQAVSFVTKHFVEFKGALIGIGVVLGAGVFAALVAGLFSLLTPINLIIVAAGVLGAAWAGDWLGIATAVTDAVGLISSEIGLLASAFQIGGLAQVGTTIATQLQTIWTTNIWPELTNWATHFMDWVIVAYPQIPTMLTLLVNGITSAIASNWPAISNALLSWSTRVWDWVKTAAVGAGTALVALGAALVAWASSAEAQAAALALGQQLGTMITTYLTLQFQGGTGGATVMTALAVGLLGAVDGIATALVTVGAQIVAGIIASMMQSMGVNVQPALVSQLGGILSGIGANILIIAQVLGQNIVNGIIGGIQAYQTILETSMTTMIQGAINAFMSYLGMASPSTVFYDFGINIVQGLINGIVAMAGQVSTAITGLLGGILGGGTTPEGGAAPGGLTFDPTTMLANLALVNQQIALVNSGITNISTISLPGLSAAFTLATGLWIQQIPTVQQQVFALDSGLQSIYIITLPVLQAATTTSAGVMSSAITSVGPSISTVTNLVNGLSSIVAALKNVAQTAANGIKQAFLSTDWKSVGAAIGNGIMDGLKSKQNAIKDLAREVAKEALEAAKEQLGISSPSKAFYEIGQQIVNGMTEGILSLSSDPVKAATSMIDKIFKNLSPSEVGNQMSQFAQAFATPLQSQVTDLQKIIDEKKKTLTASLNFLSDKLGRTINPEDLAALQGTTAAGSPLADSINTAVDAQYGLNTAMQEQAKIQNQLNALQTQQQQFAFLQKQIELVDFLTKQGINAAQVLKGIPLGVGANASNLLSAMQATIEASIAKMNQQLVKIPAGAAASFTAPATQTPAVAGVGGNTSSTNYNFQMTVNSGASPQAVIQQFNIAKAMLT